MPTIAKLKAELFADTRQFDRSMRRSGRTVRRFSGGLSALARRIGPLVGAFGFGALIRSTVRETDQMADLSRRLGANIENFSRLARVLGRAGIGLGQVGMIMQRLQRRAADAAGGNEQLADAFDQLGIDTSSFLKLKPTEQFLTLAAALDKVTPQANKVLLAFKLLDSEGAAVLQADLGNLNEEMAKTNAVTDEQAVKIKALSEAWQKLGENIRTSVAETFSAMTRPAQPEAQAALIKKGLKGALDPFRAIRESIFGANRGAASGQAAIEAADARGAMLHGGGWGALSASDAIMEQLRAINSNTEKQGAVLE